ncbi:hypothetical protein RIR_jg15455.t1 [Rhizophagus irregularis DAOM 181602=DAOM 197198]|nr:hypothetical protein RIR_jg15455.t1 [Rhizophagus irregularis DAOM 181602=DAOM 197198]
MLTSVDNRGHKKVPQVGCRSCLGDWKERDHVIPNCKKKNNELNKEWEQSECNVKGVVETRPAFCLMTKSIGKTIKSEKIEWTCLRTNWKEAESIHAAQIIWDAIIIIWDVLKEKTKLQENGIAKEVRVRDLLEIKGKRKSSKVTREDGFEKESKIYLAEFTWILFKV